MVVNPGYVRTNLSKNAVTKGGGKHGKMDSTTDKGMDPDDMAKRVWERVERGEEDIDVNWDFKTKVAVWLRFNAPKVLGWVLGRKWRKEREGKGGGEE